MGDTREDPVDKVIASLRLKYLKETVHAVTTVAIGVCIYILVLTHFKAQPSDIAQGGVLGLALMLLAHLRLALFEYRVRKKYFGGNIGEAREIINHAFEMKKQEGEQ